MGSSMCVEIKSTGRAGRIMWVLYRRKHRRSESKYIYMMTMRVENWSTGMVCRRYSRIVEEIRVTSTIDGWCQRCSMALMLLLLGCGRRAMIVML